MASRTVFGTKVYTPAKKKPASLAFTPYQPPPIPTGSYDPSIDAQVGATNRGLADTEADAATQASRLTTDYGLNQQGIIRDYGRNLSDLTTQRDESLADLNTQSSRNLADLTTQRDQTYADFDTRGGRNTEDYNTTLANIARGYQRLAGQQQQSANAAGVLQGGAMLQAAAKRAANQALDDQPVQTQYNRGQQDIATQRSRVGSAYDTQSGRINEDLATQTGRINSAYDTQSGRLNDDSQLALGQLALNSAPPDENNPLGGRQFQDLATSLSRAQRETGYTGLDAQALKSFQASQAGYVPPGRGDPGGMPSNEFVDGSGNHYRVIVRGNVKQYIDSTGKVIKTVKR